MKKIIDATGFKEPLLRTLNEINRTDSVRLWSIQTLEVWREFERRSGLDGIFKADGRRIYPDFRFSYRWLMGQMRNRIFNYKGGYPIWAWVYPKPDLRGGAHLSKGAKGVRIEFLLPLPHVLLLDFGAWHFVLNGEHLGLSEQEDEDFERLLPQGKRKYQEVPPAYKEKIEQSWEKVFDLVALNRSDWAGPVRYIQAVTEYIPRHNVVGVTRFIQR